MAPDLFKATTARHVTRQVIFEGVCPNIQDDDGNTPLHAAIKGLAPLSVVSELVRLGAQVNALNGLFQGPLFLAVYHADVRHMELLMDAGARVDGVRMHASPLHAAVFNGYFERVDLLLARGANPNQPGISGSTPIFAAKTAAMVQHLMRAGANPYQRNREGMHAIDWWHAKGQTDALEGLAAPNQRATLKLVGGRHV